MIKHLKEENLSYIEHMKRAMIISVKLFYAGTLCLNQAIFPFLFTKSASNICKNIIANK